MDKASKIPVSILAGFLGSGKTTLLNRILTQTSGIRYAVMVNDFGELAIDEMLIREHDGDTISFANGCVCCSLSDNLVESIEKLLNRDFPPQQFLIEVSGIANPSPIADVATLHHRLRRDMIITMVDVSSIEERLDDPRMAETITMQLKPAGLIALNKTDLATDDQQTQVRNRLATISKAPMVSVVNADLPMQLLNSSASNELWPESLAHQPEKDFYQSVVTPVCEPESVKGILLTAADQLLRAKGFVFNKTDGNWYEIQYSGHRVDMSVASHVPEKPALVLIGLGNLQHLEQQLAQQS